MSVTTYYHQQAAWTFTQGFLVGQACFIALCLMFIRYVLFSPHESEDSEGWRERRAERAKKPILSTTAVPPPPTSHVLNKAGYDMSTHPPESTDWLNVLAASILQGYRNDLLSSSGEEGARQQFEKWLNPPGKQPSWLDPIQVTALNLGNGYPLLSNARVRPADGEGHVRAELDIDFSDSIHLTISTAVLINFPRPRFAVLPVSIGVELVSVGGTLSVQLHNTKNDRQHLHMCLLPDFHFNLKTSTLLGSRAKLQDIPKLEQLIVARLRQAIQDRYVYPHQLMFGLPRLIYPTEPLEPPSLPTTEDLRQAAVGVMSRSIGRLGQGLADRVASLAPADSASLAGGSGSQQTDLPLPEEATAFLNDGDDVVRNAAGKSASVPSASQRPPRLPPRPSQRSIPRVDEPDVYNDTTSSDIHGVQGIQNQLAPDTFSEQIITVDAGAKGSNGNGLLRFRGAGYVGGSQGPIGAQSAEA